MPGNRPAAILESSVVPPTVKESLTISKRKPPSQRPERALDETAKAIARAREDAAALKSADDQRPVFDDSSSSTIRAGKNQSHRKASGPAPAPSTKRPKSAGI